MFVRAKFLSAVAAVFLVAATAACSGGGTGAGMKGAGGFNPLPNSPNGTQLGASASPPPSTISCTVWHAKVGAECQGGAFEAFRFYPDAITVNAGDTITWTFNAKEPHTVTFLAPGQKPPKPNTPQAHNPAGGSTEDGSTFTNSGFKVVGQTYSLTFTKVGTYKLWCLIHQPAMVGTIVVQPAGSAYPKTQSQIDSATAVNITTDLNAAQAALALFPFTTGGTHLAAGISPGLSSLPPSNVTVMRFLDGPNLTTQDVSIPVGTTLTWTNESNNGRHTVTFPVAGQTPPPSLGNFAPPQGPSSYDGTTLVHSGVLLPGGSFSLTFTKAGTFTYYCLFHDDNLGMIAKVTVH